LTAETAEGTEKRSEPLIKTLTRSIQFNREWTRMNANYFLATDEHLYSLINFSTDITDRR